MDVAYVPDEGVSPQTSPLKSLVQHTVYHLSEKDPPVLEKPREEQKISATRGVVFDEVAPETVSLTG